MIKIKPLSSASLEIQNSMAELRNLIAKKGLEALPFNQGQLEEIFGFLKSNSNKDGDFYKYYFDSEGKDSWSDPMGNNMLLLVLAYAAHNNNPLDSCRDLAFAIIDDAKEKLNEEGFYSFINFTYHYEDCYKYYLNSPLTLAIKVGFLDVASVLVDHGADITVTEGLGDLKPLHLLIPRLILMPEDHDAVLLANKLSQKLKDKDLGAFKVDLKKMLNFHFSKLEELPIFKVMNEEWRKKFSLPINRENEERPHKAMVTYSFNELSEKGMLDEFVLNYISDLDKMLNDDQFLKVENFVGFLLEYSKAKNHLRIYVPETNLMSNPNSFDTEALVRSASYDSALEKSSKFDFLKAVIYADFSRKNPTDYKKFIAEGEENNYFDVFKSIKEIINPEELLGDTFANIEEIF